MALGKTVCLNRSNTRGAFRIIFGGRGVVSIDVGVCVNPDEFTVGVTFEGPSTGGDGAGVVSRKLTRGFLNWELWK